MPVQTCTNWVSRRLENNQNVCPVGDVKMHVLQVHILYFIETGMGIKMAEFTICWVSIAQIKTYMDGWCQGGYCVQHYLLVQLLSDFGHIKPENACFGYCLCSFPGKFLKSQTKPSSNFWIGINFCCQVNYRHPELTKRQVNRLFCPNFQHRVVILKPPLLSQLLAQGDERNRGAVLKTSSQAW